MVDAAPRWVVLKFGGTSVSSRANWLQIAGIVRARLDTGCRVLVVHSALSGITDKLERLLDLDAADARETTLAEIESRHRSLARDLGVEVSPQLQRQFEELHQIAAGVKLVGEVSDRSRARVMAAGELMSTELGAHFLRTQGMQATWVDARTLLSTDERRGALARGSVLSATCDFTPDAATTMRLNRETGVVITQGFIARNGAGHTVLLGRGGSDTSAAYLAAKVSAERLEIWTDVPGMFSANPRATPTARLLRTLHYDEAQEIATSGAKVLHPRCILPARQYQIPLHVYATQAPHLEGTVISASPDDGAAKVKAICIKKGITLIAMDSPGMWHQVGFVADAFQVFKEHGMSVDLISTSETNVTVSLDPAANTLDADCLAALVDSLSALCRVQVIGPCASVSLVGRDIRAILHQLGGAFELFEEQKIYLVSQAANDLNFTFVVDENQGDRLVEQLHELLIHPVPGDTVLGPTWEQLFAKPAGVTEPLIPWWHTERDKLLTALGESDSAYVYHLATVARTARALRGLNSVSRVLYAMKANPHPEVLRTLAAEGIAFECVSQAEIERVLEAVPQLDRARILFTPNFAPRHEYAWALAQGIQITVDNLYVLAAWPELFRGASIFVRLDTGVGRGHHAHVRTAGAHAKFGIPLEELDRLESLARDLQLHVTGLHAHTGSGVFDVSNWERNASLFVQLLERFPEVRAMDVGGGLGVPERTGQPGLDLARLDEKLAAVRATHPAIELWIEPGRYLIAEAGVLLARVTQLKSKGDVHYIGIGTGMNSLIRPALYGAHHDIVNLTRLDQPADQTAHVVGPICESADFLGHDRRLPQTAEGDVLLIATAGAYGAAMSSHYNLRAPAVERVL